MLNIRYLKKSTMLFRRVELLCSIGPVTVPPHHEVTVVRKLGDNTFVRAVVGDRPAYGWLPTAALEFAPF